MNLVQTRISGGGAGNAVAHVLKMDGNESIQVLAGSADEAFAAEAMAMADGHKFGLRHIIINPDEPLTDEQFEWMIDQINAEYGFDPDDPMLVVKHEKPRQSGEDHIHVEAPHFHILRASSSKDGKVYDAFNFQKRNELIARRAEVEFGHRQIKGAHNKYVYHQLLERGDQATAEKVHHLTEGSRAHAKYGSKSKAKAERGGVDLPSISAAIAELKGKDSAEMAKGLADIEEQFPGITIDRGDRRKMIVVRAENQVLLNANKALGIKAKAVDDILKAKTEISDDRPTDRRRVESSNAGQLSGAIEFTGGTDATGARDNADVIGGIPEPDARGASDDLEPDLINETGYDPDPRASAADRERARRPDATVARGNPRDDRENGDHTARAHERTRGHQETTAASNTGRDAGDATLTAVHKIQRKRTASELAPALVAAKKAVASDKEPEQLTARHKIERRRTAENMKTHLEAAKRAVEGPKQATVQQKIQRNHAAQAVQDKLAAAQAAVAGETAPSPASVTPIQAIKRSRIARNLASALAAAKRAVFGDPKPTIQQKIQRAATASALAPQLASAQQAIFKQEQIDAKNTEEATRSQEAARRDADDIELIDTGDDFKEITGSATGEPHQQLRAGRNRDAEGNLEGLRDGSGPRGSRGADQRNALDARSDLGRDRGLAGSGERPVQRASRDVSGAPGHQPSIGSSNADSRGRPEGQPVSRSALAAHGQRYMASKAASGARASRRSLEQSTKRMKNRHKGDMNISAAQAMLNERSGGSPQFATLDGDDFQALIAFFQQNQATLRNSI